MKIKQKIMYRINKVIRKSKPYKQIQARLVQIMAKNRKLRDDAKTNRIRANESDYNLANEKHKFARLEERVDAISKNLCKTSVQRSPSFGGRNIIRICMEFDSDHIEGAFIHGDDDFAIRYVGESIGREAAQLIRRANYHRWETVGGTRQEHYSNADYNQHNGEQYR